MSRRSKVVVLCEDNRTQRFVRRFLQRLAYKRHEMRFSPVGNGSGEQLVRKSYPSAVRALRKSRFPDQALITVIDADKLSVQERIRQLEQALDAEGLAARDQREHDCVFVPKRSIETWIRVLCGDSANEDESYKPMPNSGKDRRIDDQVARAAEEFFAVTREGAPAPKPTVDSLNRAIPEARRVPRSQ